MKRPQLRESCVPDLKTRHADAPRPSACPEKMSQKKIWVFGSLAEISGSAATCPPQEFYNRVSKPNFSAGGSLLSKQKSPAAKLGTRAPIGLPRAPKKFRKKILSFREIGGVFCFCSHMPPSENFILCFQAKFFGRGGSLLSNQKSLPP